MKHIAEALFVVLALSACNDISTDDTTKNAPETDALGIGNMEIAVTAATCNSKHGNVTACDATAGCAYYYCSNQCHVKGTSNCAAGCNSYCANTYNYTAVCPTPAGGRYSTADVDAWSFYKCECTSYAADKLNERGIAFNNQYRNVHWGNASNWKKAATSAGVTVSSTPKTGDVAWFSGGHVAYVESVNANGTANITEYNYSPAYSFKRRSSVTASAYLRF